MNANLQQQKIKNENRQQSAATKTEGSIEQRSKQHHRTQDCWRIQRVRYLEKQKYKQRLQKRKKLRGNLKGPGPSAVYRSRDGV